MKERVDEFERTTTTQLLGFLNFSEGKADARFAQQLNEAHGFVAAAGVDQPWAALRDLLQKRLAELRKDADGPFRQSAQAEAVLELAFGRVLDAYRRHHADLLFHLEDKDLFQPYFLVRVVEAVLAQGGPWNEAQRIVHGAVAQLNDFVGHRPIAVLENRPRGEPYDHEKVRPIPLYLREAGPAGGAYHDLIEKTLAILRESDPGLLNEACFDADLLDELALDPRAYDHGHPANRRPNYVFGEWDPHHLDGESRFRRFVVRRVVLEALLERVNQAPASERKEFLFEAAAVLAGTMLMASGTSGSGPASHSSVISLGRDLLPRIARYREAFYEHLLSSMRNAHGDRLRLERDTLRQPFGAARQQLNQYLAHHRARQMQQRRLALLFASMGYPEESRQQAQQIPTASLRMLSEIQTRLATGRLLVQRGQLAEAAGLLPEIEDLLQRGIACGALADPWNILGFQGLFPIFQSQQDAVRDIRLDELAGVIGDLFSLYAKLSSECASAGRQELVPKLNESMRGLAGWWDQFASTSVSDVRGLHGGSAVGSAEQVAHALAQWHERGEASADLAFWKEQQESFRSPKAFALVVDTLLRKQDFRAAMALMMTWLGQAEQVPLEDGEYSFHDLALRWMLAASGDDEDDSVAGAAGSGPASTSQKPLDAERAGLIKKFFDYLEANAEDYWQVPDLHGESTEAAEPASDNGDSGPDDEDDLYGAAWEGVTYKDSTGDDDEGAVAESLPMPREEFQLETEAPRLSARLRFHTTLAHLWQVAAQKQPDRKDLLPWLETARGNLDRLLAVLDEIHNVRVPAPTGSHESNIEYHNRLVLRDQLVNQAIATCLDTLLALGALLGKAEPGQAMPRALPDWASNASQIEQAILQGDVERTRAALPDFLDSFRNETLLDNPLMEGATPRQVLRVRLAQSIVGALLATLPRLGLLHETFQLLRAAARRGVIHFNALFQTACQNVVEAVVDAARSEDETARSSDEEEHLFADLLEKVSTPFVRLWLEHSRGTPLSVFETLRSESDWKDIGDFIRRYGTDLFHPQFMNLANFRSILHNGTENYLEYLASEPDPLHPVRLIDDLDKGIPRPRAVRCFEFILVALIENYDEWKDFNTTTAHSDFGENLYLLLDFLRLKWSYNRQAWNLQPLVLVHEVLVHKGCYGIATRWREAFVDYVGERADEHLAALAKLEKQHGMRLATVSERIQERFVRPLELDRLCACIKPAMDEAQTDSRQTFTLLETELAPWCANPSGAGLDYVPHWIRRLEAEVERVWTTRSSIALLVTSWVRVPRRRLSLEELRAEIDNWDADEK